MDLERRIRQLVPLLEHQEEAYQRFRNEVVGYLVTAHVSGSERYSWTPSSSSPRHVLSYLFRAMWRMYELHDYESALHDLRLLDAVMDAPPHVRHYASSARMCTWRKPGVGKKPETVLNSCTATTREMKK